MAELKPCPFCGGKADMVQPGTRRHSCIVECLNCGCRLESGDEGEHSGYAWNNRVPDDVPTSQPQQVGWCWKYGDTEHHKWIVSDLEPPPNVTVFQLQPVFAHGVTEAPAPDLLRRCLDTISALLGDMEGQGSRTQIDDDLLPDLQARQRELAAALGVKTPLKGGA